ncbi:PIG-L family deacetylase [Glycomyces sp. TRM65418]|uniref:PIG-L deacetylase family protein n=1 Tax=Glycomyces sp. TRM65418 TaxID=2867006 RepID=UPI001CE6D9DF|nr:PIG-L deacetylase family protein [Glycomyces sp. TRM65418]MCC3764195.1 PIG-L family deacetylase [Glycomyces sp. TRM65418]QZD53879.1 PIG-L family deacetylase [Glycomyces sp. TRM65418]
MSELAAMPEDWTKALAIVAHPDDMEYGAAAAVARWTRAGREVAYLMVSRGEAGIDTMSPEACAPVRDAEQRASAAVVGVTSVEFLDHPDGVIEAGVPLRRDLAAAIRRHRPELVITLNRRDHFMPGNWNSADHRAVGESVLDAVNDAGNRWIFPDQVAEGLEPWGGVRWVALAASPEATHAVDVTDSIELGVASLLEHRAYITALTDEDPETYARDLLTGFAAGVGERFGTQYATTFELINF